MRACACVRVHVCVRASKKTSHTGSRRSAAETTRRSLLSIRPPLVRPSPIRLSESSRSGFDCFHTWSKIGGKAATSCRKCSRSSPRSDECPSRASCAHAPHDHCSTGPLHRIFTLRHCAALAVVSREHGASRSA